MQVYRGMDIGTAKPSAAVRARVPHHLVDLVEPEAPFTVAEFQQAGVEVLDRLAADDRPAVVAGGSGLHFRALLDPLEFPPSDDGLRRDLERVEFPLLVGELLAADPHAGDVVDLANPRRVMRAVEILRLTGDTPTERAAVPAAERVRRYEARVPFVAVGLDPGDALGELVERRFDAMLDAGLVEEVAALAPRLGVTAREAVGYKQLLPVVAGEMTLDDGRVAAIRATLALAKRQRTFFRRDPRIRWLPWHDGGDRRSADVLAAIGEETAWSS